MRPLLLASAVLFALTTAASAKDISANRSANVQVGETKRLEVLGAHKSDCVTSIPPTIEVTRAPRLGVLTQRADVPYTLGTSISGACLGAHLMGTAIDYTGNSAGRDVLQLDAIFPNGRAHYTITINVR